MAFAMAGLGRAEEALDPMREILSDFQIRRAELLKPVIDLEDNYASALGRLEKEYQEKGDLDSLLSIKQEQESFRSGRFAGDAPPDLLKLRTIFEKELSRRRPRVVGEEKTLIDSTVKLLADLQSHLTREGKIDRAIEVGREMEALRTSQPLALALTDLPVAWEMKSLDDVMEDSQAGIAVEGGEYVIRLKNGKNAGQILAGDSFTVPFVSRWVVATDSTNIRLYVLNGRVILGHEDGRESLEVSDPAEGHARPHRFEGAGRVVPGEFHEIEFELLEDSFVVRVDGKVRGSGKGNYAGLKGKVSIGPAAGSVLTLRKFEVRIPRG